MIKKIRKLLYPLSLLYKGTTVIRNKMYDHKILPSQEYDIPIITVGNLRVGGTGKTPQIAYLVRLLKSNYKIAVLSRGYKRESEGFILADATKTVADLGDEAYQLYHNNKDIIVAVDSDRSNAINKLLQLNNPPQVILLDDAMQHRKVKSGLTILLTSYGDLFVDDTVLPSGNLRESSTGARRAQILIVTKCPDSLTEEEEFDITLKLGANLHQTVFFSKIKYANQINGEKGQISLQELSNYKILLLTGIANPKPLLEFMTFRKLEYKHLEFPDHYSFKKKDIDRIIKEYALLSAKNKLILTTEKDYVRIFASLENLYYLAIETVFINHQIDFDKLILDYVGKNSRNSKIS